MRFFNHQEHDFSRIERGVFDDGFVDLVHRVSDLRAVSADGRLSHLIHPRQKELGCRSAEAFCVFNRRIKKFLGMHLTQPRPTNCIFSPQLDEFYHNMLWRLNEVHTQKEV